MGDNNTAEGIGEGGHRSCPYKVSASSASISSCDHLTLRSPDWCWCSGADVIDGSLLGPLAARALPFQRISHKSSQTSTSFGQMQNLRRWMKHCSHSLDFKEKATKWWMITPLNSFEHLALICKKIKRSLSTHSFLLLILGKEFLFLVVSWLSLFKCDIGYKMFSSLFRRQKNTRTKKETTWLCKQEALLRGVASILSSPQLYHTYVLL